MAFAEGRIEEEKVFAGAVFPKTLLPPSFLDATTVDTLVAAVQSERESLIELLRTHGAILFRGFNIASAHDFERVVEAFRWENMQYCGPATRVRISDRVSIANEAPPELFISFHHEMPTMKHSPSKVFFYCSQQPPAGGETSIVLSHIILQKMEDRMSDFVSKISKVGYMYRMMTARDDDPDTVLRTWKSMLKTHDPGEAERRAKDMFACNSAEFKADGSAEFLYGPMNPIRELQGKRVWFIPILGHTGKVGDVSSSYGDGSELPLEALIEYKKILEESCVDVKWEMGDVLLIDNLAVQHARRPGKPPRLILTSLCK